MPLPCEIRSSASLNIDYGSGRFAKVPNESKQPFADEVRPGSGLYPDNDIRNVIEFRQLSAHRTPFKNAPCMSLETDDLRNDAFHKRLVLLDPATSQHTATSSLDVDNGVHDNPLAESFCDLLVGLPGDLSSGDGLKLDESSTAPLECSLEQAQSPPLDYTPCMSLHLDGDT